MPKEATAEVRWTSDGCAVARVTISGKKRESLRMPTCRTEDEANARGRMLAELAKQLRVAGVAPELTTKALERIAAATSRDLPPLLSGAQKLAGGRVHLRSAPTVPTFKQIGDDWTSGKIAARYPDQVRARRDVTDDVSRLKNYVYPVLQDLPIDRVTLDHCEEVMRRLPPELAVATRRNIAQLITRIFSLAVYPLRLIASSPTPRGFLPSAPKQKAMAYLYPDEDARLLACTAIPLPYRLLWGFLAREGMREGEALELSWADLDLERGAVRLDRNKTDDPRAWALSPGVAAALKSLREIHRKDAQPTDHVFLNTVGRPFIPFGLADMLRAHLRQIGLEQERPELFTTTAERRAMRVHDLRGTFVTIALANGKSEAWISDRTGHRSSAMIARYKRTARTFAELQQGELSPLAAALPDLLIAPGLPRGARNSLKLRVTPTRFEGVPAASQVGGTTVVAESSPKTGDRDLPEAPEIGPVGQSLGKKSSAPPVSVDPDEAALDEVLRLAARGDQWETVNRLLAEQKARREARAGVVDLEVERERRKLR